MSSYFIWGGTRTVGKSEFYQLLWNITSENLPSSVPPNLLESLRLADLIRSSAITPADATKALLHRLTHPNPNVKLLTVAVFDICVKNGGTPFLRQVGDSDVSTELEALARGKPDDNRDVREKVRKAVQDWATAFKAMSSLRDTDLVRRYERLKSERMEFPPLDPTATAAMIDSLSAPEWQDSVYCSRCRTEFTTFNRKHHCRNCGDVFDQACSSQSAPLPHYGITEPVRVCDGCVKKLKEGKGASGLGRSASLGSSSERPSYGLPERSSTMSYPGSKREGGHRSGSSSHGTKSGKRSQEDDDLQRAIDASLAEVNGSSTAGPAFQIRETAKSFIENSNLLPPHSTASQSTNKAQTSEDDDPELAAAIAASLRDVAPAPSAPGEHEQQKPTEASYASLYPSTTFNPPLQKPRSSVRNAISPAYELSPNESNSLAQFSSTLEHPPPRLGDRERDLYDRANTAAPRLARGLEDTERRREILLEMSAKLGEASRLYEGLLEQRMRSSGKPRSLMSSSSNVYQAARYLLSDLLLLGLQVSATRLSSEPIHNVPTNAAHYHNPYPSLPHTSNYETYHPQAASSVARMQDVYPQQPQSVGQPLPHLRYAEPYEQQQHHQPEHVQTPPMVAQQQPVPSGYYKPSQFPSAPNGPLLPTVPSGNPWEREGVYTEDRTRADESKIGELIEL